MRKLVENGSCKRVNKIKSLVTEEREEAFLFKSRAVQVWRIGCQRAEDQAGEVREVRDGEDRG